MSGRRERSGFALTGRSISCVSSIGRMRTGPDFACAPGSNDMSNGFNTSGAVNSAPIAAATSGTADPWSAGVTNRKRG